jgi:hypothetical protein
MEATAEIWQQFKAALSMRDAAEGRERIATSSEQLLGCFDRITDQLERAIQAFT